MRRFIALLGILCLVVGLRLYNNGLLTLGYEGTLYVGNYDITEIEPPLIIDGAHRLDIEGNENTASEIIAFYNAELIKVENAEGLTIYYAYTPRLCKPISTSDGEVNLMIAVNCGRVAIGTPLLYGSY